MDEYYKNKIGQNMLDTKRYIPDDSFYKNFKTSDNLTEVTEVTIMFTLWVRWGIKGNVGSGSRMEQDRAFGVLDISYFQN